MCPMSALKLSDILKLKLIQKLKYDKILKWSPPDDLFLKTTNFHFVLFMHELCLLLL